MAVKDISMTRRRIGRLLAFGLSIGALTLGLGRSAAAATITVTSTNDNGDTGTLRWAIQQAEPGDTITFDIPGACPCSINLIDAELVIDKNLTIRGPGPTLLTVSGMGRAARVFRIASGVTAQLEGLEVSGGGPVDEGGGILNEGTLSLFDVVVSSNWAHHGGGIHSKGELSLQRSTVRYNLAAAGGGIHSEGELSLQRSTVRNNRAEAGHGGGILAAQGRLTVTESTIAENSSSSDGGGIHLNWSGTLMFVGSILSDNSAEKHGGGLLDAGLFGGPTTLVNSTISGNHAGIGGGIAKFGDYPLALINTTVTGNTADDASSHRWFGGGIFFATVSPQVVLRNTIVTGNLPDDVRTTDHAAGATSNNSLIGGDVSAILDSTLADNGGPTQTHKLVANSPAIGAGDNALIPADSLDLDNDGNTTEPLPVDQRGVGFPRIAGFRVDIGAVEALCAAIVLTRTPPPAPPSVGVAYSETIVASGGAGFHSFTATGLPGGLTLSTTGVLSGTPTVSGTFTITVSVADAYGCGGTLTYTLTIADPSCGIVIAPATLKTPYLATLYYEPLSVTPSGQYTVAVSAGALPPGVYLFAIGRNWYLGGIPSAPGTYTFTLAAKKTNSPCAPTRTYTVIVPATVLPQLTCVVKTGGKQYTAHFGYDNSTDGVVAIPVGADNYFTPGAQGRGQVTTFQKGRVTNAFSVVFTVKNNNTDLALWYLRGPDGVRRPVNITTTTSRCP